MSTQIRSGDGPLAQPPAALVDEMIARYVEWREDAAAVTDAHRRWREASAADAAASGSSYTAALDQEEAAAISYGLAVWDVERWLQRAEERSGRDWRDPEFAASRERNGTDGSFRAVTPSDASRQ